MPTVSRGPAPVAAQPRSTVNPMLISCGCPVAGAWADPLSLTGFAMRAEELGYHGLWAFQRLLIGADQDLAPVYRSVLDPMLDLPR